MTYPQADNGRPEPGRWAHLAPAVIAWLLTGGAMALVALSFSPLATSYDALMAFAARFVPDGSVASLSPEMFASMRFRIWAVAGAYLLLAGIIVLLRASLSRILADVPSRLASVRNALTGWVETTSPLHRWTLAAILLIGTAVRLVYIDRPIRNDEAIHALELANRSFVVIVSAYYDPNNQILHTILSRICYLIFGFNVWSFRIPALLSGLVLMPLTYVFANRFYGRRAALTATAFAASSVLLIAFSTMARGYVLMIVFFLCALLAAARARRTGDPVAWFALALCGAFGVWTIPLMAYALGIIYGWLVISLLMGDIEGDRRAFFFRIVLSGLGAVLIATVLFSPSIVALDPLAAIRANTAYKAGLARTPDKIRPLLWLWGRWHDGVPMPLELLGVAGLLLSIVMHGKIARDRVPLILPAALWLVPIYVAQPFAPPHRFYLFLLPVYYAFAGAGLAWVVERIEGRFTSLRGAATPVFAGLLFASILAGVLAHHAVSTNPDGWRQENSEETIAFLAEEGRPGDVVLCSFGPTLHHEFYEKLHELPAASTYRIVERLRQDRKRQCSTHPTRHQLTAQSRRTGRSESVTFQRRRIRAAAPRGGVSRSVSAQLQPRAPQRRHAGLRHGPSPIDRRSIGRCGQRSHSLNRLHRFHEWFAARRLIVAFKQHALHRFDGALRGKHLNAATEPRSDKPRTDDAFHVAGDVHHLVEFRQACGVSARCCARSAAAVSSSSSDSSAAISPSMSSSLRPISHGMRLPVLIQNRHPITVMRQVEEPANRLNVTVAEPVRELFATFTLRETVKADVTNAVAFFRGVVRAEELRQGFVGAGERGTYLVARGTMRELLQEPVYLGGREPEPQDIAQVLQPVRPLRMPVPDPHEADVITGHPLVEDAARVGSLLCVEPGVTHEHRVAFGPRAPAHFHGEEVDVRDFAGTAERDRRLVA